MSADASQRTGVSNQRPRPKRCCGCEIERDGQIIQVCQREGTNLLGTWSQETYYVRHTIGVGRSMSVSKCQAGVSDTHKTLPWLRFGCILPPGVRSVSARKLTPAEKLNDFNGCQVSGVSPLRGLAPLTCGRPAVGRIAEVNGYRKMMKAICEYIRHTPPVAGPDGSSCARASAAFEYFLRPSP